MIRHIVCFKLKDHSEEACETARDILLSMKDNVPLVVKGSESHAKHN